MPAPATTSDFFDVCRKSGVVAESSLSSISEHASSPMAAAKALIRAGVLTKFQAAQLLAGKYKGLRFDRLKILDRIGSGGMGTVFLCEHLGLRKQVAVKILPPDQADDAVIRERFEREARAAAALDHPNIVRVHDTNSSGGVHYIVMEYVDGPDLQTMINKYGPLPYTRVCGYIAQAALGLQHAHEKGLVHRDIKPANLLVDKDGVVKILDMGLARFNEDEKDNLTAKYDKGAVLGTADYMAPEQVTASSSVDIRADIYSLGATLYTLVNGKPPFSGSCTQKLVGHQIHKATSLTEIRREVPKALSAVVDKMMAKNPADRYQTPAEVVEALHPWLEMDTIPLDVQQTRKMPGSRIHRSRVRRATAAGKSKLPLIVIGVAAAAVLFGGLGVWALTGKDKGDKAVAAAGSPTPPATTPVAPAGVPVATPTNPLVPAGARLTYEIDFSKGPHFFARFEDKELTGLEGEYPPGWMSQSWRAGAAAEIGIQDHSGVRAVVIRTVSGDGASAELHTAHGASPYQFVAGRQYLMRTVYANVGNHTGSFEVRWDDEHPPVKTAARLTPTGGEWRTAELRFTAPPHDRSTTYYTHWEGLAPEFLVVRSVHVFEFRADGAARPAALRPVVVWETDFSKAPAFRATMAKPGGLRFDEGRLPDGWNAFVWKQGSGGEVAQEEFAGKTGIAFRTTSGDPSAEITTHTGRGPNDLLKAGRRYRVDLEYAAPGNAGGRLDVRLDDPAKPSPVQVRLKSTGSAWQTVSLEVPVPADRDRPFSAYVSNFGFGPENTIYVRSLTLVELVEDLAGVSLYRLSADGLKPFKVNLKGQHVSSADVPDLPDGCLAGVWRPEDSGVVTVEELAGRKALTLTNGDGGVSVQFFPGDAIARVQAGQEYTLKVVHRAGAFADGRVEFRKPEGVNRIYTHSLKGTDEKWVETTAKFTPTWDGPIHMFVQNGAEGPSGTLAIASIELFGPGGPAARGAGYRLDLAGAKPMARRYRGDAMVQSQGEGNLPAPWAGHTRDVQTVGDVFIDPVGGQPAIGIRNDQGPPSVRLFTKSGLIQAKAGKSYAVKLTYQTEASGKGGFRVAVGGSEAAHGDFEPSVGNWRDVDLTLTAATAGPLTMVIECASVGSEASVYIKDVEVRGVD